MDERVTTAGIAIKDGRVFVARREKGGPLSCRWEFPGGKQRWDESDADTLRREYMEELEALVEVGEEVVSFDFENKGTLYHLRAYLISFITEPRRLSVHTEAKWVSLSELFLLDMAPSDGRIRKAVASLLLNS